jgi:putative DNA methylase
VRIGSCPDCGQRVYQFPYPLISLASRAKNESEAYFGCSVCGEVKRRRRNITLWKCYCGRRNPTIERLSGFIMCPHCHISVRPRKFAGAEPAWKVVLVQELRVIQGHNRAVLRIPETGDPVAVVPASKEFSETKQAIPEGEETHRLRESGFTFWGDLYTTRQVRVVLEALERIKNYDISEACRDRLALATIGMAEMPGFLSRWERFHLKAFEAMANHHYSDTTLAVETNPLSPIGRGTLPQRLKLAGKALDWACQGLPPSLPVTHAHTTRRPAEMSSGVHIATGNSSKQALRSGTIELVLTDPPYYDDVQYGELARLFHFWLAQYVDLPLFNEMEEAVPNRHRDAHHAFYVKSIAACLKECRRVLAPAGRLILTFHNKKMPAWEALTAALIRARFIVQRIAVVRAENDADHSKRNGKGMLHDLVIECVPDGEPHSKRLRILGDRTNVLAAMGVAVAKSIRLRNADYVREIFVSEKKRRGIVGGMIH